MQKLCVKKFLKGVIILKEYIPVEIEIIVFDVEDVITTSKVREPEDYVSTVEGSDLSDDWT